MFRILIDTCVWLDLVKDPQQGTLLNVLDALIRENEIELIVPSTVIAEFNRNKERVTQESARSLSSVFKRVREAVDQHGDPKRRRSVLKQLDDVNHKLPLVGGIAAQTVSHIEKLLKAAPKLKESDDVKLRAAQRAIDGRAPFHRHKNSIGDALIIEVFSDHVHNKTLKGRFAFVTHNTKDFSDAVGNDKKPHPDFAPVFTKVRSLYFIKLAEALHRVRPELVSEMMLDYELLFEPRLLSEIQESLGELEDKIWYNRHLNRQHYINTGKIKLVDRPTWEKAQGSRRNSVILDYIWAGAMKSAKEKEKIYGHKNLGPWTDFEWGMLNGKFSALRWVLGEEWDMLDI